MEPAPSAAIIVVPIQANDLAVKLAVCAVIVFVGAVLLGAF
jgi:hypothetical protein